MLCLVCHKWSHPVADPGFPVGGMDSRVGYVLKMFYVETKDSRPFGGRAPDTPPTSANGIYGQLGRLPNLELR